MFTIRKATIDDRSLIHDLASRIWENTYGKILSKEQLDYMFDMMYAPDNILKQMEELHHQYFIILADDMPAGYLSIEKTGENTYNFQKIYSLPEMHGTGIGPAIGFYRHMGLREIGTRDHHIGNGYFMNDYIMGMEVENK